ncbi:MAG: hypothetical protein IJ759_00035 [Bacteroidales bacterium]|nr:hypothetical protein [Bacteroidales bacterium]
MKEWLKHISWYLIIILGAMFGVEYCTNKALKEDNERLKNNQISLTKDIEGYRLKDSSFVAQIETLSVSKDEFMQVCSEQAEEIKALNIKLKRLQNVTTSILEHNYFIDTLRVYDSVIKDTFITDTMKCFDYSDSWIRFSGCFANETVFGSKIQTFDTLTTIVHKKYRKKFLFFHWKPYYKVTLHSKNPYSVITRAEYVEIK